MEHDLDAARKAQIRDRFDRLAPSRAAWIRRSGCYYEQQQKFLRFLAPEPSSVLELGCGTGDLLASLDPRRGLGIDISPRMIDIARERHPQLEFRCADLERLECEEKFSVILLADTVGHLQDLIAAFQNLHRFCTPETRLIISYYNFLWEPLLKLAEKTGWKMPQQEQNWLSTEDIAQFLFLAGFEIIKTERRLLLPLAIPLLSDGVNRYLAPLPGLSRLCLSQYVVARPLAERRRLRDCSVSIVVPSKNEKGNIEDCVRRLPAFGTDQEIIFVDGRSTDGTQEEIQRVAGAYPDRGIKLLIQQGKGKGDAVRLGFSKASGDILMILDADLTVPPEDLPKFYHVLASGAGEFVNGSRLVYPMENQAMRLLNLMANKFFSLMFTWLLNQRFKDTLCGTKALFMANYKRIAGNRNYFGDFDPFGDFDLIFGASKLNLRIVELPVRYRERKYGVSKIDRFQNGWMLLKMTLFAFKKFKAL